MYLTISNLEITPTLLEEMWTIRGVSYSKNTDKPFLVHMDQPSWLDIVTCGKKCDYQLIPSKKKIKY